MFCGELSREFLRFGKFRLPNYQAVIRFSYVCFLFSWSVNFKVRIDKWRLSLAIRLGENYPKSGKNLLCQIYMQANISESVLNQGSPPRR
jgi:hypothetical protein